MLIKLTALSLIILCCGYIGLAKQYSYKNRLNQLLLCEKLLVNMKAIIKSGNKTKTLFNMLSKNKSFEELKFVKETSIMLEENKNFPQIFESQLNIACLQLDLLESDFLPLYSLCELIGSKETDDVIQGIDFAIINYKNLQEEAKKNLETTGYLTGKMGFLVGIFICIVIA